ncbi:ankyrin repeat domain-containing protein [Catellatospora sp. KI3]|uniref:ankyrin repeat domain-containing protein n=1 Tax=Catellatospora sp. KI3 TaxID=3041620 RepID=UPI002482A170|nr:ankyrin repeat domain-containing protein [Catellatospora sp. KI3]MDI1465150.1 ankyrin repeat domain-containing protein [Catellatospora sp. KI3]
MPSWPLVRVRCLGVWHGMQVSGGRLVTHAHSDQEISRELALSGLGGPIRGCAAVVKTWRTGYGRLPNQLRRQRNELFRAARDGDTDTVLAMIDAGFDATVVDGLGATLLHVLPHLDHERLLPLLLAAGLAVNGPDKAGETPLHHAYAASSRAVVAALYAAGADTSARDSLGRVPAERSPLSVRPSAHWM